MGLSQSHLSWDERRGTPCAEHNSTAGPNIETDSPYPQEPTQAQLHTETAQTAGGFDPVTFLLCCSKWRFGVVVAADAKFISYESLFSICFLPGALFQQR